MNNTDCQNIPLAIINLYDGAGKTFQLCLFEGQDIKEAVYTFCLKEGQQSQFKNIFRAVKQRLGLEEQTFHETAKKQEQVKPLMKTKHKKTNSFSNNVDLECTFRPKLSKTQTRGNLVPQKIPVYEKLYQMQTKTMPDQFDERDNDCTFQPVINKKSRQILIQQKQNNIKTITDEVQEEYSFEDKFLMTFNKENQKQKSTGKSKPIIHTKQKCKQYAIEKLTIIHCLFILLDGDDDNLLSLQQINWALLDAQTSEIIYPIFVTLGYKNITFSQFADQIMEKKLDCPIISNLCNYDQYKQYIKEDLITKNKTQQYSEQLTISEFVSRFKKQTHLLDNLGKLTKKYKELIIEKFQN